MNNTLQALIHELESTLARLLHEKGREDGGQVKPMVDLTPRAPHVLALPLAVSPSATIDPALLAAPALVSTAISMTDAAPSSAARATNKPITKSKTSKLTDANKTIANATTSCAMQKNKATKTFLTLEASDLSSDSEDDAPLSELSESFSGLGKRVRAVSPAWVEKPRVTRRLVNFYLDMVTRFDFLPGK
jgi:hypothetical protein